MTCGNSSSTSRLTYTWKLYKDSRYLPDMVSVSKDPRYFQLSAYSLESLSQYAAQVTVSDSKQTSSTEYVLINVGAAGVASSIKGGYYREVSVNKTLTIDASDSRDLDYPLQSNALNFSWSCFVTYPTYGASCGVNVRSQSVLSFPARSLRSFQTYNFSVLVTGFYGYSSLSSVVISVLSYDSPSATLGPIKPTQNPDVRTTITATVNCTWPCIARWSCANCNFNLSEAATTPVVMRFDGGCRLPINLVISADTMISGLAYTYTLSVSTLSTAAGSIHPAAASIQIFVNSAPVGGAISIFPNRGQALLTVFSMVTYDWCDDASDYPLQFVFSYYSYDPSIAVVVKSLSQLTYVTSYLGQGLPKMEYMVTCVAAAYDIYNLSSIVISTAIVFPAQNLSGLSQMLKVKLDTAASAYDIDFTTATIGSMTIALNAVNCSLAPDCRALNRSQCTNVRHTCGPCLDDYMGIAGPSNIPCELQHTIVSIGGSCTMAAECISNKCAKGTCQVSAKQCPGNCSGSAHGQCRYINSYGETVTFCDANSFFCQAKCFCFVGWYGTDCSFNKEAYSYLLSTKELLSTRFAAAVIYQVNLLLISYYKPFNQCLFFLRMCQ